MKSSDSMRKCTLQMSFVLFAIISLCACGQIMCNNKTFRPEGRFQNTNMVENEKQKQIFNSIQRRPWITSKENQSIPNIVNDSNVKIYLTDSILNIKLSDIDKPIYLDEIVNYYHCTYITIEGGGNIMARDMAVLEDIPLQYLELHNVMSVEEGILSHMPFLDILKIILDEQYTGIIPLADVLENTECDNIIMLWNGGGEQGLLRDRDTSDRSYGEWEYVDAILSEEGSSLQGIYRLNDEHYSYTSYEFYKQNSDIHPCSVFVSRRSDGENYCDILFVPEERLSDVYKGNRQRLYVGQDVNFDGYGDIIFVGKNRGIELYFGCTIFLWDEQSQRYVVSETAPPNFTRYNPEMGWLGYYYSIGTDESTYYIYEYVEDGFIEKRLELKFLEDEIVWYYYEDDKLVKMLKLYYNNGNPDYVVYTENGIIMEEDFKEDYWSLGEKYFPEFDLQAPAG